jgi:hypothetical protein
VAVVGLEMHERFRSSCEDLDYGFVDEERSYSRIASSKAFGDCLEMSELCQRREYASTNRKKALRHDTLLFPGMKRACSSHPSENFV